MTREKERELCAEQWSFKNSRHTPFCYVVQQVFSQEIIFWRKRIQRWQLSKSFISFVSINDVESIGAYTTLTPFCSTLSLMTLSIWNFLREATYKECVENSEQLLDYDAIAMPDFSVLGSLDLLKPKLIHTDPSS
jgi:hypothetical protein